MLESSSSLLTSAEELMTIISAFFILSYQVIVINREKM
jgi:hypothetical protein